MQYSLKHGKLLSFFFCHYIIINTLVIRQRGSTAKSQKNEETFKTVKTKQLKTIWRTKTDPTYIYTIVEMPTKPIMTRHLSSWRGRFWTGEDPGVSPWSELASEVDVEDVVFFEDVDGVSASSVSSFVSNASKPNVCEPVSYTHLTLPTNREV